MCRRWICAAPAWSAASSAIATLDIAGAVFVGANPSATNGYVGEMDEIQFSNIARSASWIRTAFINQGMQDTLLALQAAEQLGSGSATESGLFKVIIQNNDVAGWVVMGICLLMALISWMIMIGKAFYLRSVKKDDIRFLAEYIKTKNEDPARLDQAATAEDKELEESPIMQAVFGKHDHFQSSPIFRLYHRGIEEVRGRVGTSVGAQAAGLSPLAVNVIRASLDAQMMRETQRLTSRMVLLTIAVSGGPFLGLLGTVMGVMITFAAIAATGDVNIAAIAPGVAAALSATVAGLIVAIPALFGYNYLNSSIKEVVANMHMFAEEFVNQLAEYYGRPN